MLDDADNEIKLNTHKKRGARDSDWWKYNSYFMYPGSWGLWRKHSNTQKGWEIYRQESHSNSTTNQEIHFYKELDWVKDMQLTLFYTVTSYEGYNAAQPFTSIKSKYLKIYGMKLDSRCLHALLYFSPQEVVPFSTTRDN